MSHCSLWKAHDFVCYSLDPIHSNIFLSDIFLNINDTDFASYAERQPILKHAKASMTFSNLLKLHLKNPVALGKSNEGAHGCF